MYRRGRSGGWQGQHSFWVCGVGVAVACHSAACRHGISAAHPRVALQLLLVLSYLVLSGAGRRLGVWGREGGRGGSRMRV